MVTVNIGQDAVLPCEVEGDSSPALMWRKDGFPVPKNNNKYVVITKGNLLEYVSHLTESNTHSDNCTQLYTESIDSFTFRLCFCHRYEMLSEGSLQIHGAQLNDAGRYYCSVSNQAGSDHRGMDLRVFGN